MLQNLAIISGYILVFLGFLLGLMIWRKRQRRDRQPFPDQLRLRRGPGETQLRVITRLNEEVAGHLVQLFLLPPLVAAVLLGISTFFDGSVQIIGLFITLLILLAVLYVIAKRLVESWQESTNRYLGYFGERVVAEALEPLRAQGFRLFHDVPCGDAASRFNIDHVIIGATGVFALETKTRRKGRARDGFAAHQIIYDGQVLAYPWGEDRHGLEQTRKHARWLEASLSQLLDRAIVVQPILTFPGWTILRRGQPGTVSVLSPTEVPASVAQGTTSPLSPDQIEVIAHQLDAWCRDVEY